MHSKDPVPKKEFGPDDPLEFQAVCFPGDRTREMAECFAEEYFRLGYSGPEIFHFFKNPQYAATHQVYRIHGESFVRDLIHRVRKTWGGRYGESL